MHHARQKDSQTEQDKAEIATFNLGQLRLRGPKVREGSGLYQCDISESQPAECPQEN